MQEERWRTTMQRKSADHFKKTSQRFDALEEKTSSALEEMSRKQEELRKEMKEEIKEMSSKQQVIKDEIIKEVSRKQEEMLAKIMAKLGLGLDQPSPTPPVHDAQLAQQHSTVGRASIKGGQREAASASAARASGGASAAKVLSPLHLRPARLCA